MYAKLNICFDFYSQVILEVLNEIGHTNISTVDSYIYLFLFTGNIRSSEWNRTYKHINRRFSYIII